MKSYWLDTASIARFPPLNRNIDVDVVVIGAGITGLTAAYLLKREGKRVAVIDRFRAGGVDTMNTTAHVTCVTDLELSDMVSTFGRDHARATWDAGLAAAQQIEDTVRDERIACDWRRVKAYRMLHQGAADSTTGHLREEARLANELGFPARYLDEVPYFGRPGVVYDNQAMFHPRKYLSRLAEIVHGNGSFIFDRTTCDEVIADPLSVKTGRFGIGTEYVVIATHNPIVGKSSLAGAAALQTKLSLYTSYVVGGRAPAGTLSEALFWDTDSPYHYIRVDRRRHYDYVMVGGEDHKTGQAADTEACLIKLEATAKTLVPQLDVTHRWSGQVIEANDGLPFIGETAERQFAATGFAGNGMTFGTLGGLMARDAALGRKNPWTELFDVGRTKIKGGVWDYIKENIDYPYYMLKDRLAGTHGTSPDSVAAGEGKLLSVNGRRAAVSRDANGTVRSVSAECTHLGCLVGWNAAEQTWDCPCHGSRFTPGGEVLAGPAEAPLERIE